MIINPGTIALYDFENNTSDYSGNNYDMTNNGSVPYSISPRIAGNYCIGPFTSPQQLNATSGLISALSNKTNWTIEGYVYFTSLAAAESVILKIANGGTHILSIAATNTNRASIATPGPSFANTAAILTTGEWWYWAITNNGTNCQFYMSKANAISNTPLLTLVNVPFGTITSITFGNLSIGGYQLSGYLDNIRISNVARTSFPTIDDIGSSPSIQAPVAKRGTMALWKLDGNLSDSTGNGYTLNQIGTVPLLATPQPPFKYSAAGTYTDSQYLRFPSSLVTAVQGMQNWTASGYVYFNALTSDGAIFEIYQNAGSNYWFQILNSAGQVRLGKNGAIFADSVAGTITTGAWYYWAVVGSPSQVRAYMSPATNINSNAVITLNVSGQIPAVISSVNYGRLGLVAGRILNGYESYLRFSNQTITSFPILD